MRASALGLLLVVAVQRSAYYRLSGGYASIALAANLVMVIGLMSLFEGTLTLPGIAGLVLTVGMADRRQRDHLRAHPRGAARTGKTPKAAISTGFKKAFWTILDANITTLITAHHPVQVRDRPDQGLRRHALRRDPHERVRGPRHHPASCSHSIPALDNVESCPSDAAREPHRLALRDHQARYPDRLPRSLARIAVRRLARRSSRAVLWAIPLIGASASASTSPAAPRCRCASRTSVVTDEGAIRDVVPVRPAASRTPSVIRYGETSVAGVPDQVPAASAQGWPVDDTRAVRSRPRRAPSCRGGGQRSPPRGQRPTARRARRPSWNSPLGGPRRNDGRPPARSSASSSWGPKVGAELRRDGLRGDQARLPADPRLHRLPLLARFAPGAVVALVHDVTDHGGHLGGARARVRPARAGGPARDHRLQPERHDHRLRPHSREHGGCGPSTTWSRC